MTKSEQDRKDLKALQEQNYDEMLKMISQINNPDQKDVDYLKTVMKGKKYNRANRTELTRTLDKMDIEINPKSAVAFEKTQTPKQKKAEEVANEAKDIVKGKKPAPNLMSDRAEMFEEIREDLFQLAEKCTGYSRKQVGGAAQRLNQVANAITRLAKTTLRE